MNLSRRILPMAASLLLAGAALAAPEGEAAYRSTYQPPPSVTTAIVGATILTAAGARIENGTIVLQGGKVTAVGSAVAIPPDARVVDGKGKWVTPGIVDPHVHLGVDMQLAPGGDSTNELTNPNGADNWIEYGLWPQDPAFPAALAAGVTTMQVLPGSGNLFGGRSVVIHPIPATSAAAMKLPDAPYGLKMACGENPARIYGAKGQAPSTVMGDFAGDRATWQAAREYDSEWTAYERQPGSGRSGKPPKRDLKLDTLREVLHGRIRINMHCYRADEMVTAIEMSHEFGYRITSFHHAVEAYKIAPLLAREGVCSAVWAQPGPAKLEMSDLTSANAALLERSGACVAMHSDGPAFGEHLALEAAIAMAAGNRANLNITPEVAIRWLTINPARLLGIDGRTGSLQVGKAADVVLWNHDPFSAYAQPERVFVDGALMFDRSDLRHRWTTDLELGRPVATGDQ
jgi:imidazolonepropionase-like amidohydrolase